jgi:hypothetical protein
MRDLFALCLFACCSVPCQALDWPRDLNGVPAANATDTGTIKALINRVLAPEFVEVDAVREFRFVPLESLRRVDLIASIDTSGRGMFNAFIAVWQSSEGGYGHVVLSAEGQSVLARDVVDLDGTGVYEVVAGTTPGGYQGFETLPIPWYGVYRLKLGKWVDVSDRYPEVFRDFAVTVAWQVGDACSTGDRTRVELYMDSAQFVMFKDSRALRHDSLAGLERALVWAGSSVPSIQVLAVETLREIPDPRAVSALRKLTGSPDIRVSMGAKDALSHMGAGAEQK